MQDSENNTKVVSLDLGMVRAFLLLGAKRHVLIDSGPPGSGKKILPMLAAMGIDPKDISLIVLTHDHTDHIGGAWAMKQATGAPIAMHLLDAEAGRTGEMSMPKAVRLSGKILTFLFHILRFLRMMSTKPFEPDILIAGEMALEKFGVAGKVVPTPGHTPGSLSIVLESGEALVGDLIGGKKPSYSPFGESLEAMASSLHVVLDEKPRIVFGSHGGPFTPEEIKKELRFKQ